MVSPPGLLILDDLHSFAPWSQRHAPAWRALLPEGGEMLPPTALPPPGLVVVARTLTSALLEMSVPWLRGARRVALLLDTADEPDRRGDPERAELAEMEQVELREALGNVVWLREVSPRDLEAHGPALVAEALARVRGDEPWPAWRQPAPTPAAPPGPWLPWSPPRWSKDYPPGLDDAHRHLAAGLTLTPRGPALLDALAGERLDLATGAREPLPSLAAQASVYQPLAALPGGARWLGAAPAPRGTAWRFSGAAGHGPAAAGGYGRAIGVDPSGQVAWTGDRCWFQWRAVQEDRPAFWTPSAHGWPDGHGKKLYGYQDNDPLHVHLAPDASAALSTYEHDVLLTDGLPLRWRRVGGVAVPERRYGEPRALFFERADGDGGFPGDPTIGDEDARDHSPVVSLGPSPRRRVVVGLTEATWRLRGEVGERLGGPDGGWVVFAEDHRPVHRGEGRLLAGWHRWIVVLRGERLARVDLETDAEQDLGPAGATVTLAVAVPGSPNVVLLSLEGEAAKLRLV